MKLSLLVIGKTNEKYLEEGIRIYDQRLKNYTRFEMIELKDIKGFQNSEDLKKKEAEAFLEKIKDDDVVVLLDENGKMFSSVDFSQWIENQQIRSVKHLVFIIGGAFGVHEIIKQRSNLVLSFSKMTFSHQMIRLFFTEQVYRAFSIIKNEKYHNP
ncbi:MAG: 23S rRNA (pseudouridine(1915)-N(3))-methyltransferase RlmH [Saprospiraceae bacterium]|nr:23S rRNA (pseudouridine(1915)-N(3))-methyltransferase RlmH [Saprospiraceae bacterium]